MMQRAAQPAKPVLSMAGRTTARVADTMRRGTARARAAVGRQVGRARDFLRGTAGDVGPGAACAVRCFAAGTLVLTPSGYLAIDEVEVGDYVLSQSEDGEAAFRRVEATWERVLPVTELTVVSADGDEVALRVTAEHPFYVEGEGWTEVGDRALGDLLLGTDGELLEVVGLHATDDVEVVYNLTVEGFHTYFVFDEAGVGVWSHNCGGRTHVFLEGRNYARGWSRVFRKKASPGLRSRVPPEGHRTFDVSRHGNLSPGANRSPGHTNTLDDGFVQSHHAVQDAWARSFAERHGLPYSSRDAAAILLPSRSGESHALISAFQRARRRVEGFGSDDIRREFRIAYEEFLSSGVPVDRARRAMGRAYKYFDSIGAFDIK